MSKKNSPLSVDEEKEQKAKYNGMLKADIESAASAIRTQKQKASTLSGDLSAKMDTFEGKGGHKKMLKWATSLSDLEPAEAQDAWRALTAYAAALGVFDQIDMFDQQRENELNAESVTIASQPQQGAEPVNVH